MASHQFRQLDARWGHVNAINMVAIAVGHLFVASEPRNTFMGTGLMLRLLPLIFCASFSLSSFAQNHKKSEDLTIRLKCSGVEETDYAITKQNNSKKNITFIVVASKNREKTSINLDGLGLMGMNANLADIKTPPGLIQLIADDIILFGAEFTMKSPISGGGRSYLNINRYSGTAKLDSFLNYAAGNNAEIITVSGQFSCDLLDKKRF